MQQNPQEEARVFLAPADSFLQSWADYTMKELATHVEAMCLPEKRGANFFITRVDLEQEAVQVSALTCIGWVEGQVGFYEKAHYFDIASAFSLVFWNYMRQTRPGEQALETILDVVDEIALLLKDRDFIENETSVLAMTQLRNFVLNASLLLEHRGLLMGQFLDVCEPLLRRSRDDDTIYARQEQYERGPDNLNRVVTTFLVDDALKEMLRPVKPAFEFFELGFPRGRIVSVEFVRHPLFVAPCLFVAQLARLTQQFFRHIPNSYDFVIADILSMKDVLMIVGNNEINGQMFGAYAGLATPTIRSDGFNVDAGAYRELAQRIGAEEWDFTRQYASEFFSWRPLLRALSHTVTSAYFFRALLLRNMLIAKRVLESKNDWTFKAALQVLRTVLVYPWPLQKWSMLQEPFYSIVDALALREDEEGLPDFQTAFQKPLILVTKMFSTLELSRFDTNLHLYSKLKVFEALRSPVTYMFLEVLRKNDFPYAFLPLAEGIFKFELDRYFVLAVELHSRPDDERLFKLQKPILRNMLAYLSSAMDGYIIDYTEDDMDNMKYLGSFVKGKRSPIVLSVDVLKDEDLPDGDAVRGIIGFLGLIRIEGSDNFLTPYQETRVYPRDTYASYVATTLFQVVLLALRGDPPKFVVERVKLLVNLVIGFSAFTTPEFFRDIKTLLKGENNLDEIYSLIRVWEKRFYGDDSDIGSEGGQNDDEESPYVYAPAA